MDTQDWILLIDPFKNLVDMYQILLETENFFVETAKDLEEAFHRFSNRQYSVVITEYFSEVEDSCRIIPFLKNNAPATYILMVTYKNIDDQTYGSLFDLGLDDLIIKPCSPEKILVHIQKGLRQREWVLQKQELERQMILDPIARRTQTYIFSQSYFKRCLRQELKRAKRRRHPLSLLLLQIPPRDRMGDHFELFFAELAKILRGYIREEDVVGRENGNLGILLPETDQVGSRVVLQRLFNLIQSDRVLDPITKNLSFQSFTYPTEFEVPQSLKKVLEEIDKESPN